jgi:hypothetical protein
MLNPSNQHILNFFHENSTIIYVKMRLCCSIGDYRDTSPSRSANARGDLTSQSKYAGWDDAFMATLIAG